MLKILLKIALTLGFLVVIFSLVGFPLLLAFQDSDVGIVLIYGGSFIAIYSSIFFLLGLSIAWLGGISGRLIFIEQLILSIAAFGLGLMLASLLSLLLFILLQLDTFPMIEISLLALGGFSILIAFLLGMTYVLVNVWCTRL